MPKKLKKRSDLLFSSRNKCCHLKQISAGYFKNPKICPSKDVTWRLSRQIYYTAALEASP